jgi:hypothetical protein
LKTQLQQKLHLSGPQSDQIRIGSDIGELLTTHDHIVDATPERNLVADRYLTKDKRIVIPGVPPGISEYGFNFLDTHVIHDKLELGVAGMAVGLLI